VTTNTAKYRLVTRADFDGLVCAALLKEQQLIDEIVFVHPKDVTSGEFEITARDITTNLPYSERCFLAFDHHASEALRLAGRIPDNLVLDPEADSAARLVYRYYGGRERFPGISEQLLVAVDKADAARFTEEDILAPSGWELLNFVMDPRTGLGRFPQFAISNFDLMMRLIDHVREQRDVEEILALPDVQERVQLLEAHRPRAIEQIRRVAEVHGNVVVLDLRDETTIWACNRFMVYALFPGCNVSVHVLWGRAAQNTILAIGNSIFDRTQPINIGELCMRHGGGGHASAGTIQVAHADAPRVLAEVIRVLGAGDEATLLVDDDEACHRDLEPRALCDAEAVLEETLSESGMSLLPTRQDIRALHERLDRIERMLAELTALASTPAN
jgi:nanoRNase/pAp phosphatase (c-di-AMP/oligoRNAs hydrolase)